MIGNRKETLISSEEKTMIEEICTEYLKRISSIENTIHKSDISLSRGVGGIILFLSEARTVLKLNTDELMFNYLKYVYEYISVKSNDLSLYTGITGLAYAVSVENELSGQYSKFLGSLDEIIFMNYSKYRENLLARNYIITSYHEYDIISGLSGIARYVLARCKSNEKMIFLLDDIQNDLCKICCRKLINDKIVEGFATGQFLENSDGSYYLSDTYSYNLGMAHGVSGIVAILSLISMYGYSNPESKKTLKNIVSFIESVGKRIQRNIWPNEILIEDVNKREWTPSRCAWCYGNPGVASALFLAANALNSCEIENMAQITMAAMFDRSISEWKVTSPMICHGYSGILEILLRFGGIEEIKNSCLIEKILKNIDYNKKYCFKNQDFNIARDSFGFLEGSAGVLLVLLNLVSDKISQWDQVLLIS